MLSLHVRPHFTVARGMKRVDHVRPVLYQSGSSSTATTCLKACCFAETRSHRAADVSCCGFACACVLHASTDHLNRCDWPRCAFRHGLSSSLRLHGCDIRTFSCSISAPPRVFSGCKQVYRCIRVGRLASTALGRVLMSSQHTPQHCSTFLNAICIVPSVQNLGPSMVCDVPPEVHSDSYESRLVSLPKASPDVHASSSARTLGFHQPDVVLELLY